MPSGKKNREKESGYVEEGEFSIAFSKNWKHLHFNIQTMLRKNTPSWEWAVLRYKKYLPFHYEATENQMNFPNVGKVNNKQ